MQKINELVEELKTINEILKIFSFPEFEKDLQVKKEETTIIPQNTLLRNGIKLLS